MPKAKSSKSVPLPKAWGWGGWSDRIDEMRVLPRRVRVLLAAEWALSVLPIFEARYPGDNRPRLAIEAAELWALAPTAAAAAADAKWKWLYATYRHARGPKGLAFLPEWRTDTAVSLAKAIVAERAFDRMPYLADALQDAGCDNPELMRHLQEDHDEFTAADWCLWNLLELGSEA